MDPKTKLILAWLEAGEELEVTKKEERTLRDRIHAEVFESTDAIGTHRHALGDGYFLRLVTKENITVERNVERVEAVLTKLCETPDGPELARTIFKWKPELSTSVYKSLLPAQKVLIDEVLTIKPGAPSLEYIRPKNVSE